MEFQVPCPGVENGEHADGAADIAGVAGEIKDRPGHAGHQQAVADDLIGAHDPAQFLGHGDGDVEMVGGQHLGFACF